ncbi:MAG: trehalose-6-phosphate synthase, partial [Streptosporangiaceae bacterium]
MVASRKDRVPGGDDGRIASGDYGFVVVASRLPVDRGRGAGGETHWRASPGGLVAALEPVVREAKGAWVGWPGDAGPPPEEFNSGTMHLAGVGLSATEMRHFYEGFCNATLWPLYHDVIAPPEFHRTWWESYVTVNRRFARAAARQAAPGATIWVHDYQLQLVPGMLRELRQDVRIGFFNHIPFPGYEIFAQLPWRRQIVAGLVGADLLGFQRQQDATNFLRACRRAAGLTTRGQLVRVPDDMDAAGLTVATLAGLGQDAARQDVAESRQGAAESRHGSADSRLVPAQARPPRWEAGTSRVVRAATFPISIDTGAYEELAAR